ncbi:MAG: hypothetical protein Q9220_004162 [cf. Caloplaca sp. 1 TL-2023]
MNSFDLEAAAGSGRALGSPSTRGHNNHEAAEPSLLSDQSLYTAGAERLSSIAVTVVERLYRWVARPDQEELRTSVQSFELSTISSAEEPATAGARDDDTRSLSNWNDWIDMGASQGGEDGLHALPLANPQNTVQAADDRGDPTATTTISNVDTHSVVPNESNQNSQNLAHYKQKITPMGRAELDADKDCRKAVRQAWRRSNQLEYIEDPWNELQRRTNGDSGKLLHEGWCSDTERRDLQLDLVDALSSVRAASHLKRYMPQGIRATSCWISLVGLRLAEIYGEMSTEYWNPADHLVEITSPFKQLQILVECIWTCQISEPAKVGDVLISCYRRRILQQPNFDGSSHVTGSTSVLRGHIRAVFHSLYLINVLYKHDVSLLKVTIPLDEAWYMLLSVAETRLRHPPQVCDVDMGPNPFLTVSDLNLRDLQVIGRLQVRWTAYWDEHLELERNESLTFIKIYWFSAGPSRTLTKIGLCGELHKDERFQRAYEILRTRSLLLTSKCNQDQSRKQYEKLNAPLWLRLSAHKRLGTWSWDLDISDLLQPAPPLSRFKLNSPSTRISFCLELEDHAERVWPAGQDPEIMKYSEFPYYGKRLRELRCFMDSQQPKGPLAMWRDKRNSNTYYTFWLVALFGGLSVLLAFCSLAVAIVQTWAQFQSLD